MSMRFRSVIPAVAAVVAFAAVPTAARAQQAPNLSGTWELDASQSNFGMMPPPQKATVVIEHQEPTLKVTRTTVTARGERTTSETFTTDGKESKNAGPMGNEYTSVLKWDGVVLTNTSKRQMQGNEIDISERWTVAPDGKTLTIARTVQSAMMPGPMEMKEVLVKK